MKRYFTYIFLAIIVLSSCTVHNLRTKWTSFRCPEHSVNLHKGIVKTVPSGPVVHFRDDAFPYTMVDSLPLKDGNAKLKYQKAGCIQIHFEYAKIYYCPICEKERKQLIKADKNISNRIFQIERSDSTKGLIILSAYNFIKDQKYSDKTVFRNIYSRDNVNDNFNSFMTYSETDSAASRKMLSKIDSLLNYDKSDTTKMYIAKNRFINKTILNENPRLKNITLSKKELKTRNISKYIKIKNINYPPKRWKDHYVTITYDLYPFKISIFNNIINNEDNWVIKFYRFNN